MAGRTKHPFFGFLPRHVTAKQVQGVVVCCPHHVSCYDWYLMSLQEGNENPFTRLPHSPRYHQILETRKKLPVFVQMDGFYKLVSIRTRPKSLVESKPHVANASAKFTKHQIIVIVGETGTGKTTQYAHLSLFCVVQAKVEITSGYRNLSSILTCRRQKIKLLHVHNLSA